MTQRYTFHAPGGGVTYDWENDQASVKVGAADTGHAYTLVEDNLQLSFALGLHLHRQHSETFYVLEGSLSFYVDGDWLTMAPGACLHIPPGVPHAVKVTPGSTPPRMLMIYQPSGIDTFLAEMAALGPEDLADAAQMIALQEKYDIFQLGPLPDQP